MKKESQKSGANFGWQDFETEAIQRLKDGEELGGKDGVLAPLIKRLLEASLEGELDVHLGESQGNRRNGKGRKQLKTSHGAIELETGRDRQGSFEPQLVKKRQVTLGEGLDNKVISMYARGMSYEDIQGHLEELYGLELSKGQLSHITDKVLPVLEEWRSRPLEPVYVIVWMDALHFKVRHDGRIENRAVYCVLGIDQHGNKDLLGLYLSENEGARLWLQVLTDLQNRGVDDLLIACIDNLTGFASAIESIFPQTEVQLCIVHQIRNSLRYITSGDQKAFVKDLKKVYQAASKDSAEYYLDELEKQWGEKYPVVILSWRTHWLRLSQYFKYPHQIRRLIYTTNTVEGFNRQIRKITKSKGVMPSDTAVLKLVFLIARNIMAKWTMPLSNWALVVQQLAIHFEGRLKLDLSIENDHLAAEKKK